MANHKMLMAERRKLKEKVREQNRDRTGRSRPKQEADRPRYAPVRRRMRLWSSSVLKPALVFSRNGRLEKMLPQPQPQQIVRGSTPSAQSASVLKQSVQRPCRDQRYSPAGHSAHGVPSWTTTERAVCRAEAVRCPLTAAHVVLRHTPPQTLPDYTASALAAASCLGSVTVHLRRRTLLELEAGTIQRSVTLIAHSRICSRLYGTNALVALRVPQRPVLSPISPSRRSQTNDAGMPSNEAWLTGRLSTSGALGTLSMREAHLADSAPCVSPMVQVLSSTLPHHRLHRLQRQSLCPSNRPHRTVVWRMHLFDSGSCLTLVISPRPHRLTRPSANRVHQRTKRKPVNLRRLVSISMILQIASRRSLCAIMRRHTFTWTDK